MLKTKITVEAEACKNLVKKFNKKKTAKIVSEIIKEAGKIKITDEVLDLVFKSSK